MLKANTHSTAGNFVRLNTLFTNTGQVMPVARQDIQPWLLAATDALVASGGGRVCSPLGDCELTIARSSGGALLCLRQGERAVGMAILAWHSLLENFLWSELLRATTEGLKQDGAQQHAPAVLERPALPWLAVVLWPSFLREANVREACQAESIFWSVGHSLLQDSDPVGLLWSSRRTRAVPSGHFRQS